MKNNIDISKFIEEFEVGCTRVQKKTFHKGDVIINYSENNNELCILISGIANLVKYDYSGNRFVTERFSKNSIFGDIFFKNDINSEFFVEAKEKCEILFFPYDYITENCNISCSFHERLVEFLPNLLITKILSLSSRVEILSMRSTRDKLLEYFNQVSKKYGRSFTLPFSITELSSFLSVDRCSMSRELANLKKDKIIKQDRNKITLLY